jgi:DNA-binding response OmpR family regulator
MALKSEKKTILVVEDETDIQTFVAWLLTLEGFKVSTADNGEDGLELARAGKAGLMLLDLRLPGRDGWSVLAEMKSDTKLADIPVIIFSASAASPQKNKALRMGAADYLVKPLSSADIRTSVNRASVLQKGC